LSVKPGVVCGIWSFLVGGGTDRQVDRSYRVAADPPCCCRTPLQRSTHGGSCRRFTRVIRDGNDRYADQRRPHGQDQHRRVEAFTGTRIVLAGGGRPARRGGDAAGNVCCDVEAGARLGCGHGRHRALGGNGSMHGTSSVWRDSATRGPPWPWTPARLWSWPPSTPR
jgi:hypothetical protein